MYNKLILMETTASFKPPNLPTLGVLIRELGRKQNTLERKWTKSKTCFTAEELWSWDSLQSSKKTRHVGCGVRIISTLGFCLL